MSANERIERSLRDEYYGQLAPSQADRTEFVPGKASSRPLDANWPTDFRVPTGNSALDVGGPAVMARVRVEKLDRGTICDQELVSVPDEPENTTQENDGRKERRTGYDWSP